MTREEAIEILQGAIKKPNTKDGYLGQAIDMAIKALEQEPKTGHWIKDIHNIITCSYCGKPHDVFDTDRWFEEHKYCYSCGAKMAESEAEYDNN